MSLKSVGCVGKNGFLEPEIRNQESAIQKPRIVIWWVRIQNLIILNIGQALDFPQVVFSVVDSVVVFSLGMVRGEKRLEGLGKLS